MVELFLVWFLIFVRAGAMLAIFPIFAAAAMPVRLRLAIAGFLALLTLPGVMLPPDVIQFTLFQFVLLVGKEVMVGLMLGFVVRLIMFSVALAGHYIGTEMGLQLASLIAPGETDPSPTPSVILALLTVMLMFALDVHFELLLGFQQSYAVLPIGGGQLSGPLFSAVTAMCAHTFVVAVRIAAPVIAVGIVVSLLLMVLAKTIPQINVFIESFSVRILVGVFLFGFTLSMAARQITEYLHKLPDDFVVATRLMGLGG